MFLAFKLTKVIFIILCYYGMLWSIWLKIQIICFVVFIVENLFKACLFQSSKETLTKSKYPGFQSKVALSFLPKKVAKTKQCDCEIRWRRAGGRGAGRPRGQWAPAVLPPRWAADVMQPRDRQCRHRARSRDSRHSSSHAWTPGAPPAHAPGSTCRSSHSPLSTYTHRVDLEPSLVENK